MILARSIVNIITLRNALLALAAILSAAAALNSTRVDAQQAADTNQVLQNCITFKNLADQHASQAETVQKIITEEAKQYSGEEAHRFVQTRNRAADSEWELAGLAQESYRKCMKDYLGAAQVPVQQAPVATQTPAPPSVRQPLAATQLVPAPQPAQMRQPVVRQQPEAVVQGPGVGLIPFGLGILGAGRVIRENR